MTRAENDTTLRGMARGEKLLERMRHNPRDWRIEDVKTLCNAFDIDLDSPSGGSHYGASDPAQVHAVTMIRSPCPPDMAANRGAVRP